MCELEHISKEYRKEILDLAVKYNIPHVVSAFSIVEILIVLYEYILKKDDKFLLSKGHASLGLYVALLRKGNKPKFLNHSEMDVENGIEFTGGSLGHGLPIAVGMAFGKKIIKHEKGNIYVLLGDGECQEGTIWESLLIATHHKLNNLIVIIDNNRIQVLDETDNVISLGDLKIIFGSMGCNVFEVDGHNISDIINAINRQTDKPKVIIANTIKGKGFSLAENKSIWHAKLPKGKELLQAYKDLE